MVLALPICGGLIIVPLYQLIDLYFVAELGKAAIAGVGAAANAASLVTGLTQMLSVGSAVLISHAVGRRDREDANLVFNQSIGLAMALGMVTLVLGAFAADAYVRLVSADQATIEAGVLYLKTFLPALALQFAMQVIIAALRGAGVVRPTMAIRSASVALNMLLAPVLIAGWGTGVPLGVAGAGLATSLAVAAGVAVMWIYFGFSRHYVSVNARLLQPRLTEWSRILRIGMPAGAEFAVMFVYMAVVYYALGAFGATAQAGFGVGARVLGIVQTPVMALAYAAGPIIGQCLGASNTTRVHQTIRTTAIVSIAAMLACTVLLQLCAEPLTRAFTHDPQTVAVGVLFLRIVSLSLVPQGLVFVCSSAFQGLGDATPSLISSGVRLVTYAVPLVWLVNHATLQMDAVWWWALPTTTLQAGLSLWLLQRALRRRAPTPRIAATTVQSRATPDT